jgi:ABC-type transport system substrate-binding protein
MIGKRLADRYEIVSELGRGGMGIVYRARDPLLNRDVAVKLIPPTQLSPDSAHRFQREAQVVAQMDHPAIVSIHDFGRHDESLFFVMPLVQGMNLRTFLRQETVLGEILDIGVQVAEALDYSHARGVVHRDIKPENIMVSREDGVEVRVRVMDFGLARAASESRLTKTGSLVGTLHYVSPELVAAKEVDGRADVYALGTVLYECVVGTPPFTGDSQSVLYRIVHEFPQSPRAMGASIDEEFDAIIMACLAKEPTQRPQRANELAEALKRYRARLRDSDRARSMTGFTRTFMAQRPALSPFVGRTKEFGELQQRLNAAVAGECQFVVVAGEPGIGKTRLLDELANLAKARQIRVLHGRSVEQDRAFAYQGFCEIIQEYFRLKETGSAPAADLQDLAGDLLSLFPMLSEINEIRSAATGDSKLARGGTAGPENRTQVFEVLARTLTRIAGGKPLVLILEDLHGAEVTLEALPYIVTRLGPTPTLILGSYRTTDVDRRHPLLKILDSFRGDRRFSTLTLGPLSPSDHRTFVETLVGGAAIPDTLAQSLYEGTEANPFFTKELVRSLVDSGGISRDDTGQWSLSGEAGLSAEAMPATIQEVVERRIERLPEDLRDVLSMASVIGKTFDSRDLEALAKGTDVDDAIDRLVQQGLIEEERESRGELLSFSSGVVRDVLYGGLSPRKRRSLHRKCAELLEARHAGRLERVLAQLVHHFTQGDVPEKAVNYGLRLAKASLDTFSVEEAGRAAKTALTFLDAEWEGGRSLEGEARIILARIHRISGDIEGALREAGAAARIFEQEKQPARAVAALQLAAETAWQARRTEEAVRWVTRGLDAARAARETESLRELLSLGATLANLRGDYEKANEYQAEAAPLLRGSRAADTEQEIPRGGCLIVGLANPIHSIVPPATGIVEESEIAGNVFETLLATDPDGSLVPRLCERWEADEMGRSFVLTLRPDVRFQGGRSLKASDVKQSFEDAIREMPREAPAAFAAIRGVHEFVEGKADGVVGIIVSSDIKLEIRLQDPLPIYPALLSDIRTGIRLMQEGAGHALGTGPFRIASLGPERIVLERNEEYWRSPALLGAIEYRLGLRAAAIASGFRSGDLDVARDLLPQDLEEILRDPRFRAGLAEIPKKDTYFVLFNSRTGPAARSPAVRRALSGILRTRDLVWRTVGRFAEPAVCLIPPGMLGHDPGKRRPSLDREQALELLHSANLALPIRLSAAVHPLLQDRYGALTKALFETWSDLGVEVQIVTPDMESFLGADVTNEAIDMKIGRWIPDYDDPDNFTHTLFHSETGRWRSWFSSGESDRILEEARAEKRPAAREALYRRWESLLQEAAALVALFHDIDYRLGGPRVRGLELRGGPPFVNYSALGKLESAAPEPEIVRASPGTVHVPIAGIVGSPDPALTRTFEQAEVMPSIFESLTRAETGARIVPWLAAEWRVEEGGRRYRFRLRDDVRFHDGRRLSARDVRYSFERLLQSPDGDYRWTFSTVKGAKSLLSGESGDLAGFRIHSGGEFSIELEEPVAFFPALVSYPAAAIVPEGSDPSGDGGLERWVGTGPFRVVVFEPGRRLELERNQSYWRKGYPRSRGLVYTFGVSPEEMLAGLRAGRFSLASDLFPADVEALRRDPDFASGYREAPRLITYYAAFATHRGPLADRVLRRRLIQAVDVPRLVRQTIGRLAIPAQGLIPPGLLGHDPVSGSRAGSTPSPAPDLPSTAVELTAAIHPVFSGGYSAFARELGNALGHVGFKIRPVSKTMAEWMEATTHATVDIVVGRWGADFPDADSFAYILHSDGGPLGRLCGSSEVDRILERGRAETAPAIRHAIYRELEEMIGRDALLLPLFHEQTYRFARPEVEGLTVSVGASAVAYEELGIRV